MPPVAALTREVKRRNPFRFARDRREIGLIRADSAVQLDVGQPVAAVRPHENALLRPRHVIAHRLEHAVELVPPPAHILCRPLEFRPRHRRIDKELQLAHRQTPQIMLQLPRLVRPVKIIEPLRHILVTPRHGVRWHLVVRPERRLALIPHEGKRQHQRAVGWPRTRVRAPQLLEPGQRHGRKIIRFQLAEKFAQEFLVPCQLRQKILSGSVCHRTVMARVIGRQQRLQNFRRHTPNIDQLRRRRQRAPRTVGRQRHPRRHHQ